MEQQYEKKVMMDSGDWECIPEDKSGNIINDNSNDSCISCEEEAKCFHKYEEHLKNIKNFPSGDYFKEDTGCCNINDFSILKSCDCELSAFLNIGAEAEKRREDQFQNMMCNLEKVSQNNKLLHTEINQQNAIFETLKNQISESKNIICNLKSETNTLKQKYIEAKRINQLTYNLQTELETLKLENTNLESEIEQINWKYKELQDVHNLCSTPQENQHQMNTIANLNDIISEAKLQIQNGKEEINYLTESNELLQNKICQLTCDLKEMCQKQCDKNKSYDGVILKLQCQLKKLNNELISSQEEIKQKDVQHQRLKSLMKDIMHQNNDVQCKKIDELQEVIKKQANSIKCLEEMNSVTNSKLETEFETLDDFIVKKNKEMNNLTNEMRLKTEEDVDSIGLLNEVCKLNYDINIKSQNKSVANSDTCSLLRRIIKIRCRVQSRIQREQFKFAKATRDLCMLRCKFAKLQKEIESLRTQDCNENRDEIRKRINLEQELSKAIIKCEKEAEYSKVKLAPLQKTLNNIDRMREVVQHLN